MISPWLLTVMLGLMSPWLVNAQTPDLSFPSFQVAAQAPQQIEVGSRMGVLVDSSHSVTREQALESARAWQPVQRAAPNFGFTNDAYWFRLQIDNREADVLTRFIELPIPFIDDVRLFHYSAGKLLTSYALGDEKPFAQRPIKHQNFVMPLKLAPGVNQIYLRLASAGTIEAPLRIWSPKRFYEANDDEKLMQGLVIGILLIMVVYNLFVFFSTRDVNYLYYIGFVASYLLFHLTLTGYTFAYLWPNAVRWNSFAISTFIASSTLFTCLFTSSFLRLDKFSMPAYYLVSALSLFCTALLLLTFVLPYSLTVRVGAALTIPIAATALALGYWRWWRGAKFARFYCLAWTAVLISLCILNAGKFGLIPTNVWTENASQIGVVLLVLLLSFTLADRINHDRALRINAQSVALANERKARASQQALILAKEQANRELEQRVAERTTDLHRTLDQLKVVNDQLQLLSNTDGLTQISNRAFFDAALASEWRRASRSQCSLALIMFDIDHFKQINDTHGHPAGDACLRALAALLQPKIGRAGDVLARYGGEEFIVLLLDTRLLDALALAETFRADIEKLAVRFEDEVIHFSASLGVACCVAQANSSPQEFLALVDKALYQAKHDGRNCVRFAAQAAVPVAQAATNNEASQD